MSAIRYVLKARPRGYTDGLDPSILLASGKLTSTTTGAVSTIITVPAAPKNCDLYLEAESRYVDDVAKTGGGYCFFGVWNADETPAFTSSNVATEVPPRYTMAPPVAGAFQARTFLTVNPGQKFAIAETGWAA